MSDPTAPSNDPTSPPPEEQLPPYVIEGARSSRAKCKTCRRKIDKGTLRLGILIEGPYGVGHMWHHLRCAARRQFDRVAEAYEAEAWKHAKEPPEKVPDLASLQKLQEDAEQRKKAKKTIPYAEVDPSGRAKCKNCEQPMEKGALRVVLGGGVEFGSQVRVAPINVHPGCVADEMKQADCETEPEGFADALRANSRDVTAEQIQAVLGDIGELS